MRWCSAAPTRWWRRRSRAILILVMPYTGTRMDEPATPIIFYIVAIYRLGRYAGLRGGPVALVLTLLLVFADLYFVNSEDNDVTDIDVRAVPGGPALRLRPGLAEAGRAVRAAEAPAGS